MRIGIYGFFAAAALVALSACGGGGESGGSTGGDLAGTMNVGTFVVPEGETRRVIGDLVMVASGNIVIEGNLVVNPGVNMVLSSTGDVNISGSIATASVARGRGGGDNSWTIDGGNIALNSGCVYNPDGDAFFVSGDSLISGRGSLTVNGAVIAGDGKKGTIRGEAGGQGGAIEIGTQLALDDMIASDPRFAGRVTRRFRSVSINGELRSGYGGDGASDTIGMRSGTTLTGLGGNGGNGGRLAISAIDSIIMGPNSSVTAGGGGDGGWIGSLESALSAHSGMEILDSGDNFIGKSGSGGNGGDFVLLSEFGATPVLSGKAIQNSRGGRSSNFHCAAGNGGPGGKGGDTEVTVGLTGKSGTGGTIRAVNPSEALVKCSHGGNGGLSPKSNLKGGRGGAVTVVGKTGSRIENAVLQFLNYANGGHGFSDCDGTPFEPGSDGGRAQTLSVRGAYYDANASFDGGRGGDGVPYGKGGAAGFDDSGTKIGNDGLDGKRCNDRNG